MIQDIMIDIPAREAGDNQAGIWNLESGIWNLESCTVFGRMSKTQLLSEVWLLFFGYRISGINEKSSGSDTPTDHSSYRLACA